MGALAVQTFALSFAGLAAVFYLGIWLAYRLDRSNKRNDVKRMLGLGRDSAAYHRTFGTSTPAEVNDQVDSIFHSNYGFAQYWLPIVTNGIFAFCFVILALTHAGLHVVLLTDFTDAIFKIPPESLAAATGAFLWGIYETIENYPLVNLTPLFLHGIWFRMLVVSIITPMLVSVVQGPIRPVVAFGIGLFPVQVLLEMFRRQVRSRFHIATIHEHSQAPNLHKLQGVTEGMLGRLSAQGFESTVHLATADPVKMLITTNLEFKMILDLIDQSILFGYLAENMQLLRPFGIRGAIELASIQEDLLARDQREAQRGRDLVRVITATLKREEIVVSNLIQCLYDDLQVSFIWTLWGELDSADEDDPPSDSPQANASEDDLSDEGASLEASP